MPDLVNVCYTWYALTFVQPSTYEHETSSEEISCFYGRTHAMHAGEGSVMRQNRERKLFAVCWRGSGAFGPIADIRRQRNEIFQ